MQNLIFCAGGHTYLKKPTAESGQQALKALNCYTNNTLH